ncbi:TonB-dependent receptor plug domain-containing protein [Carboxylicivirga caseinilyticus]|uniref:TonB-dependent receptor plug domain-containing protein n=1 Tax=Carboxylicivirga caseinilyticus TaxID=3417572 RepID=UPI003D33B2E5|nr:TonB-dependent receptor [Marinilabiliaceae bacterium A049]
MKLRYIFAIVMALAITMPAISQEKKKTREEVLNMTMEEMSSLPLEELMGLMDIVGVSSIEELYDLLLNKDVTSASKKEESLFDSPLSTTVLSHDEIQSSGATCIEEALRLVPGIIVREKNNGNYDVHIRGLDNLPPKNMMLQSENTSTLVMINGRPVFNYAMGGIIWESLPVSLGDIDRIEVVRGPSSALYGPNAVSGAINIITKTIDSSTPLISANIQGGNLNTYMGDIGFRKQINSKFSIGVTGNYETRNRNNDELYVFKEGKSFSKDAYEVLTDANGYTYLDPKDDIDELFPDPGKSKEKSGINGYLSYEINSDAILNLSGGYQYSFANASTLGDNATSMAGRESKTSYVDLNANLYGFDIQGSYMFGFQDFGVGNLGFQTDMAQFNSNIEYNLQLKNLSIRPGVNYMSVYYDDSKHIPALGSGFFNGKKDMNIFATSLRLDYLATEKLRLVAALRAEKYAHSDQWTPSWQFVSSYKINDKNNFRLVYSRANRSPFIIDLHSNFLWDREGRPSPDFIYFGGNKNMDVMVSDLFEAGYRTRPSKNVLIDIEAYYSKSKNFTVLAPDSTNFIIPVAMVGTDPTPLAMPTVTAYMQYQNIDLEAKQMGLTISLDWVLSEKLIAKSHLSVQQTKLDNYNPVTRDEMIAMQANAIYPSDGSNGLLAQKIYESAITGQIPQYPNMTSLSVSSDYKPTDYQNNFKHEATPNFWGSIGLNYKPTQKLNIFSNAYIYGKQTFMNQYDTSDVDSKIILNLKANYQLSESLSVFANLRNILNNEKQEFAFMDEIGGLYLVGLNFKL